MENTGHSNIKKPNANGNVLWNSYRIKYRINPRWQAINQKVQRTSMCQAKREKNDTEKTRPASAPQSTATWPVLFYLTSTACPAGLNFYCVYGVVVVTAVNWKTQCIRQNPWLCPVLVCYIHIHDACFSLTNATYFILNREF